MNKCFGCLEIIIILFSLASSPMVLYAKDNVDIKIDITKPPLGFLTDNDKIPATITVTNNSSETLHTRIFTKIQPISTESLSDLQFLGTFLLMPNSQKIVDQSISPLPEGDWVLVANSTFIDHTNKSWSITEDKFFSVHSVSDYYQFMAALGAIVAGAVAIVAVILQHKNSNANLRRMDEELRPWMGVDITRSHKVVTLPDQNRLITFPLCNFGKTPAFDIRDEYTFIDGQKWDDIKQIKRKIDNLFNGLSSRELALKCFFPNDWAIIDYKYNPKVGLLFIYQVNYTYQNSRGKYRFIMRYEGNDVWGIVFIDSS